MKPLFALSLLILLTGCASVSSNPRPASYSQDQLASGSQPLFDEESRLDDAGIKRVLDYQFTLPEQNRIALLKVSVDPKWQNYSESFAELNESIVENFVGKILKSSRVYDASFLPSFLVPEQRTISYLREAAARYQADLLLLYRNKCHQFLKYRIISTDETKAICTTEVALLDTRTGIVPFTVVSKGEFITQKSKEEFGARETEKRAEMEALAIALGEAAEKLVNFMGQVPKPK